MKFTSLEELISYYNVLNESSVTGSNNTMQKPANRTGKQKKPSEVGKYSVNSRKVQTSLKNTFSIENMVRGGMEMKFDKLPEILTKYINLNTSINFSPTS